MGLALLYVIKLQKSLAMLSQSRRYTPTESPGGGPVPLPLELEDALVALETIHETFFRPDAPPYQKVESPKDLSSKERSVFNDSISTYYCPLFSYAITRVLEEWPPKDSIKEREAAKRVCAVLKDILPHEPLVLHGCVEDWLLTIGEKVLENVSLTIIDGYRAALEKASLPIGSIPFDLAKITTSLLMGGGPTLAEKLKPRLDNIAPYMDAAQDHPSMELWNGDSDYWKYSFDIAKQWVDLSKAHIDRDAEEIKASLATLDEYCVHLERFFPDRVSQQRGRLALYIGRDLGYQELAHWYLEKALEYEGNLINRVLLLVPLGACCSLERESTWRECMNEALAVLEVCTQEEARELHDSVRFSMIELRGATYGAAMAASLFAQEFVYGEGYANEWGRLKGDFPDALVRSVTPYEKNEALAAFFQEDLQGAYVKARAILDKDSEDPPEDVLVCRLLAVSAARRMKDNSLALQESSQFLSLLSKQDNPFQWIYIMPTALLLHANILSEGSVSFESPTPWRQKAIEHAAVLPDSVNLHLAHAYEEMGIGLLVEQMKANSALSTDSSLDYLQRAAQIFAQSSDLTRNQFRARVIGQSATLQERFPQYAFELEGVFREIFRRVNGED